MGSASNGLVLSCFGCQVPVEQVMPSGVEPEVQCPVCGIRAVKFAASYEATRHSIRSAGNEALNKMDEMRAKVGLLPRNAPRVEEETTFCFLKKSK